MARLPRLNLINIPQHIVQIGHNNLPCFFCDDDYAFYLQSLRAASDQYKVDVHAYVLLPSMIQIVATPNIPNGISSMMQSLGRRYVQYINHRYKRSGTLWGGRYKSSVIDSSAYLLTCYRYVELRPLHTGLVDEVEEYPWSSLPHHIGLSVDSLIIDHPLFIELGDSRKQRCYQYQQLFKYEFGVAVMDYIAETVSLGQILGGDGFKDQIEKIANVRVRPLKRGRPKKSVAVR